MKPRPKPNPPTIPQKPLPTGDAAFIARAYKDAEILRSIWYQPDYDPRPAKQASPHDDKRRKSKAIG